VRFFAREDKQQNKDNTRFHDNVNRLKRNEISTIVDILHIVFGTDMHR